MKKEAEVVSPQAQSDVKVGEEAKVEKEKKVRKPKGKKKEVVESTAVAVVEKKTSKALDAELALENQDRRSLEAELLKNLPQIFNEAQRRLILNETPKYVIKQRKGKGGLYFDYVDTGYILEQLNILTGFRWDFEVLWTNYDQSPEYALKVGEVITRGKLTIYGTGKFKDITLVKVNTGNHQVTYKEDKITLLSFGNDIKASESDTIKRCARLFGIALDVYSGVVKRSQDENHPEHPITEGQRKRLEALANEATIGHSGLKKLINEMFDYSTTTDIQRRHFEAIQQRLELMVAEKTAEPEMPEDIKIGFEILGTPKAKRIATYNAYKAKGEEGLKLLKSKMSAEADKRANAPKEGQDGNKK